MQVIQLRGLTFIGCHGCTAEEKGRKRPFLVDIDLEVNVILSILSDLPADTVDWTPVRDIAERVITGAPRNTVETLAGRIAVQILFLDKRIRATTVTVTKPDEWDDRNGVPGVTVRFTQENRIRMESLA